MDEQRTQFDYLLNGLLFAAQAAEPAKADYAGKRRALFAYVRDLERRATPAEGAQSQDAVGLREVMEGMKVLTPDGRTVEIWNISQDSGVRCSDLRWYCASELRHVDAIHRAEQGSDAGGKE